MTAVDRAAAAVRHHYDVGNEFYALWLDPSLTYSCALRTGTDDTLEQAQDRKLRYHLDAVGADAAARVLDVGCGWGAILKRLSDKGVAATGLTLSLEQAAYVRAAGWAGVDVHTEHWVQYRPAARFDGIISIGAFEHFAGLGLPAAERIETYREFFRRCRDWLTPGGALSLQTIAYANMSAENADRFVQQEIFPDAELPTLAEIAAAADQIFEVVSLRNDRLDYAWTCRQWAARLRARRAEATALVGPEVVARYERYLTMSSLGFHMGKLGLLRIVLRPYGKGYFQ